MTIPGPDSSLLAIRKKVRRLTASPNENSLTTTDLDQYIQTYYNQDFPYSIKLDQMRDVYTFYTQPYRDRYPLNVNYNQGVRSPFYVDGIQGNFYKDRTQFFNVWPRFPTLFHPFTGDGTTQVFNFNVGTTPILSNNVTLGGIATTGAPISVADDGNGNMLVQVPNPQVSVPPETTNVPGMKNLNTGNPGDQVQTIIGTVDYVTSTFALDFSLANVIPASGSQFTLWVCQYQTGRPYSLLFWNNEFTIRPVPKLIHRIEIETYLTPIQFLATTDTTILNQWWQLLAYGAAREILRDRQDLEGVANLEEGFQRQEALVLERQAVEEIFQPNITLFNSTTQAIGGVNGIGYWW